MRADVRFELLFICRALCGAWTDLVGDGLGIHMLQLCLFLSLVPMVGKEDPGGEGGVQHLETLSLNAREKCCGNTFAPGSLSPEIPVGTRIGIPHENP